MLLAHVGVVPVEVRLLGSEKMEVPLPGVPSAFVVARPRAAAEHPSQSFGGSSPSSPRPGAEPVTIPLAGSRAGGQRLPEPAMPIGAMVGNDVDDDPDAEIGGLPDQLLGLPKVPNMGRCRGSRRRHSRRPPSGRGTRA